METTTEFDTNERERSALYNFAYLGKDEVFRQKLETLKDWAMPEDWDWLPPNSDEPQNAILRNYIVNTFERIKEEYDEATTEEERQRKIATSDEHACFNTGLFTKNFSPIFMYFEKNRFEP